MMSQPLAASSTATTPGRRPLRVAGVAGTARSVVPPIATVPLAPEHGDRPSHWIPADGAESLSCRRRSRAPWRSCASRASCAPAPSLHLRPRRLRHPQRRLDLQHDLDVTRVEAERLDVLPDHAVHLQRPGRPRGRALGARRSTRTTSWLSSTYTTRSSTTLNGSAQATLHRACGKRAPPPLGSTSRTPPCVDATVATSRKAAAKIEARTQRSPPQGQCIEQISSTPPGLASAADRSILRHAHVHRMSRLLGPRLVATISI